MTATTPAFREESAVFRTSPSMPGRFASNFDFQLSVVLGTSDLGGATVGESFSAVSGVADGDLVAWSRGWREMAERVHDAAEASETSGHAISAADAYLRSATYWRAAGFFLDREDADRLPFWHRQRDAFRASLRLAGIPHEIAAIPFDGRTLPGYFIPGGADDAPRKTSIILPGGDTTAEEHWVMSGRAALARGYNVLLVELPGQRGAYYSDPSLTFRPDVDRQLGSIVDWLLTRPGVDPERIALSGYSMGGLFAPRGAAGEPRIRAVVASCLTPTFATHVTSLIGLDPDEPTSGRTDLDDRVDDVSPMAKLLLGDVRERFGMLDRSVADYIDYLHEFDLWGLEDRIAQPLLNIGGEAEGDMIAPAREFSSRLAHSHDRLISAEEGGDLHCAVNNRALANQIEYDFLDGVLDGRSAA